MAEPGWAHARAASRAQTGKAGMLMPPRRRCKAKVRQATGSERAAGIAVAEKPAEIFEERGPQATGPETPPFRLVEDRAPTEAAWSYPLRDTSLRSFVGHLPEAMPKEVAAGFYDEVDTGTPWSSCGARRTAWVVASPCACKC